MCIRDSLLNCVQTNIPLEEACTKWYKEFDKLLHQFFKKMRITSTPPKRTLNYQIHKSLLELKDLKVLASTASEMSLPVLNTEIALLEKKVSEMHGSKCKQIIQEETNNLCVDGVFNPNEAWALKKKLFPQSSEPPFAVLNENKELVTDSDSILDVMKNEFKFRLRNREINTEYEDLI